MKQTLRFIAIIVASAVMATVVTMAVDALGVLHYRYAFVTVYAVAAVIMAALLGAFRDDKRKGADYTSIKDAARYGEAA